MTSNIAHFNGQLLPLDQIRISPLDRGFIFGDGVYEVIPVYDGAMLRGREHFERLQRSMDEIRLDEPAHRGRVAARSSSELLAHHPGNQSVYIQVTRGVPPKRDHVMPEGPQPTVFMMCYPLASPSKEQVENGVACVTARDFRWEKCHIKSTSLLGNVLARQISADAGATETIMFRDGFLTEASASNVFVVKDGVVARAAAGQPDPARHHLRPAGAARDEGHAASSRSARSREAELRSRRRGVALVLHQGSARGDHARRQARGHRQARPGVQAHARALPGAQGAARAHGAVAA